MRPRAIFGRLVSGALSLPTRSLLLILVTITSISVILVVVIFPNALDSTSSIAGKYADKLPLDNIKNIKNIITGQGGVRKPPKSVNSTASAETYYSHWDWRHPFSSSLSRDEDRIVLPPLEQRCTVYTYFDSEGPDAAKEKALVDAWRKAYWAYGFRPTVLRKREAEESPFYAQITKSELHDDLQKELVRWTAWHYMKGGILVDYRLIPMGDYDAPTLVRLRKCRFEELSRFEDMPGAFYAGGQEKIETVLSYIANRNVGNATTVEKATEVAHEERDMEGELWDIIAKPPSMAWYTKAVVAKLYPSLKEEDLPALISAHQHETFHSKYPDGIKILAPVKSTARPIIQPLYPLAKVLTGCPKSPLGHSCPPNRPKCEPCIKKDEEDKVIPRTIQLINSVPADRNNTFLLASVPHPFSHLSVMDRTTDFTPRYIRRETARDVWIHAATSKLLNPKWGNAKKALVLKDIVHDRRQGLWFTTESAVPYPALDRLEWHFGFSLPPVELQPPTETLRGEDAGAYDVLEHAAGIVKKRTEEGIVGVLESWNLADSEVWKFVGAVGRRWAKELEEWESEEKKFYTEA